MHPRLALVSIGIRRDLLAPLRAFTQFDLLHLYRASVYGDLTPQDMDATLFHYGSPFDLYRQLIAAQPAVIQAVEPFSYYTQQFLWACYFAARRTGAALLSITYENRPLETKFGRVRGAFLRLLLHPFFARACLLLPQNAGAERNLIDSGASPQKIVRVLWGTWGVDLQEFTPRPTENSAHPPTILFAGRLHAEKGVFVLLDAFALLQESFPSARLCFVGDGPARAALEQIVRERGLSNQVTFTGTIKHREMPAAFQSADIFCAPSITTRKWAEQVGASAMQAMASGLPVVSTTSGAIPEYVPDRVAGILVPERDPAALAAALESLLKSPAEARAFGARGRAYASAHFDAAANVRRGEQLVMEHCLARRV